MPGFIALLRNRESCKARAPAVRITQFAHDEREMGFLRVFPSARKDANSGFDLVHRAQYQTVLDEILETRHDLLPVLLVFPVTKDFLAG